LHLNDKTTRAYTHTVHMLGSRVGEIVRMKELVPGSSCHLRLRITEIKLAATDNKLNYSSPVSNLPHVAQKCENCYIQSNIHARYVCMQRIRKVTGNSIVKISYIRMRNPIVNYENRWRF